MGKKAKTAPAPGAGDTKPATALPADEPAARPTGEGREDETPGKKQGKPRAGAQPKHEPRQPENEKEDRDKPAAQGSGTTTPGEAPRGSAPSRGLARTVIGIVTMLRRELRSKESLRYLGVVILSIAITIGIALALGQGFKDLLETNASNGMHLFGIVTTGVAFFAFMRYLKSKRDILYIQTFTTLYFVVYFLIVVTILVVILGLAPDNVVYLYSTFGNALILFSAFVLIIFLLNPEVLGISGENFTRIFKTGQHVRVIGVYLFIALTQITGFSLLNLAINSYTGPEVTGPAYAGNASTWLDFFYFSTITFVTIGYGDITPLSPAARLSAITQGLMGHVISLLFLAILLLYLSSSIGEKDTAGTAPCQP